MIRIAKRMVHVQAVRALEDNFMYIVRKSEQAKKVLLVDPVEPKKLESLAKSEGLEVVGVLVTHHHWDHAGGNNELREIYKNSEKVPIFGGDERIDQLNHHVKHEEVVSVADLKIRSLSTPCHTKGHICYHVTSDSSPNGVVLTGDTLFIAGCGKFFEGTAPQMHKNLNETLGQLPDETLVFPGHEYTVSNLRFAKAVEPNNRDVEEKLKWAVEKRGNDEDTVPSSIGEEKRINPFMRVGASEEVQKFVGTSNLVEGMQKLREAKNNFRQNL